MYRLETLMKRTCLAWLVLVLFLPAAAVGQTLVRQGQQGADAQAWPVKVTFGGVVIDPRLVTVTSATLTANAPFAVSVGVASAVCLAANASRTAAIFVNTSNATISLAESGQTAVLNAGVTLEPGAAYTMLPSLLTLGQVNCIASAAASNLSGLEKQ